MKTTLNELKQIQKKLNLMTLKGFFIEYLKLTTSTSNKVAFQKINEQYYKLTGYYRYKDFKTFQSIKNKFLI